MLISKTPPSKKDPPLASKAKLFRNVNCAAGLEIAIDGESSRLSLTTAGSLTNAAFGNESATGVGTPEFDVTQSMPSGSTAFVAVHPEGSAGGVTLSKFSLKRPTRVPTTLTEAMALPLLPPGQPLLIVNEAVLVRVEPQVSGVVLLITWARVVVLPASVLTL